jgi:hypothetical protein
VQCQHSYVSYHYTRLTWVINLEVSFFTPLSRPAALLAGSNRLDNVKDQKMEYRAPGALDFFPSIITSPFGGTRVHHCNSV